MVASKAVSECPEAVPEGVLAAFGVGGVVPERLPGGQGTTWRAGQLVLKPADSVLAGRWFADVYDALNGPGFRSAAASAPGDRRLGGHWVGRAGGGCGWRCRWTWSGHLAALAGADRYGKQGAALHALADVPVHRPWRGPLRRTREAAVIGDQVAWGERDPGPLLGLAAAGQVAGQVRPLLAALRPVDLPDQLPSMRTWRANVLFADGLPPAVIDFSPLERPAGLPLAVVAVDALPGGTQARPEVLDQLIGEPRTRPATGQRALIYRHVNRDRQARRARPRHRQGRTKWLSQPVTDADTRQSSAR